MKRNFILLFLASVCFAQAALGQDPVTSPVRKPYTIGPGDQITVKVLGEKDFDAVAIVDENGNIELPFFEQPISAMCKTERELRSEVSKSLGKYLRSPQVAVAVTERKSRPPVIVSGEVKNQQPVMLTRKTRLWELITFSGGTTDEAGGMIEVFRTQPPICAEPSDLADWKAETQSNREMGIPARLYSINALQQGKDDSNPVIYPGDVISVQKGKPVYLVGEVKGGQGGIMIKEGGLQLQQLLAMAGGVNTGAKTKDIKIYRRKPDSIDREIISVNYDEIKKRGKGDVPLQPYDIVEVGKARENIGKLLLTAVTGAGVSTIGALASGATVRVLY